MSDKKIILKELVEKLTGHGEDQEELQMWQKIFDCLNKKQQERLLSVLEKELAQLQAVKS